MRKALGTPALAAGVLIGAAAFAVGTATVPAQAATATDAGIHVQPAAPVWHHIGDYLSASACHNEGRRYLNNDWAINYDCRPKGLQFALWVLTDN